MQASHQPPDLVILDLMIPGIDGLEVCRRLRSGPGALPDLPIVIVTAKGSIPDRVRGLKTGADDYVTKPFAIEELLARIEALLRRSGATGRVVPSETRLVVADVVLDTTTREVTRSNLHLELTTKEYELLDYLMCHPRQVLRREQIYDAVWGYDFGGESNVLDVYIRYLRNKLECHGPKLIHTIRGVGYVLKERGLCCKNSGRDAMNVKTHLPVELRPPPQTGWPERRPAPGCLLFPRRASAPS